MDYSLSSHNYSLNNHDHIILIVTGCSLNSHGLYSLIVVTDYSHRNKCLVTLALNHFTLTLEEELCLMSWMNLWHNLAKTNE
jgi:hypothetical protein